MVRKQYIPLQDGNAWFHAGFPSAPITHVIVEGSIILYPESHWYVTVEPSLKSVPILVPFMMFPGSKQASRGFSVKMN